MRMKPNEVDKLEILTLQDNYVDMVSMDSNQIVQRPMPIQGNEIKTSILAEHGFASVVSVTREGRTRSMIFDFGFSEKGAADNAEKLRVDLGNIEVLALSHGHLDHTGGMRELVRRTGKEQLQLVLHPMAFKGPRFLKIPGGLKFYFPHFKRAVPEGMGLSVCETSEPRLLLGGDVVFLGEIPRKTEFERGMPMAFFEENGVEKWDPIEDDTALVANVKGKGLVVLSGCAHSGIVNTVLYARELCGLEKVHAVMGGFHLTGPAFAETIAPTLEAFKKISPDYIIPTHCTGHTAIRRFEDEMPRQFLLNMSGTKMVFSA
jgi:7,8-dihydropterin-6-yl-methyl-4-(beta-D-ribofuranosyl)aminobenzene 5'-phosphate synthase